jgi:hypothetical protein
MRAALVLLVVCAATASTVSASIGFPVGVEARARGASRVVVATVSDVYSRFDTNEFGDQLIISQVLLNVDESLKGTAATVVAVDVEGGTIGDLTLRVSDMPTVRTGERGVFFLSPGKGATYLLHRRGLGLLKLDANGKVRGSDMTIADVRAAVRASR